MDKNVGEIRNRVIGIATDKGVARVTVYSVKDRPGIAASLFTSLASANISVDVIVQNSSVLGTTDLTFTVESTELNRTINIVSNMLDDLGAEKVDSSGHLAKISIVGTGMQDSPGYAAKMFESLSSDGINIEMITTSEIRITCIIHEDNVMKAAQSLHRAFGLDKIL
jgi:aspartate kinase